MGGKILFWFSIIALTSFTIADYLITKGVEHDKNKHS